jgi:aryl-alcohol dehydrogenase-like predicted oxidoreductase
LRYRTLGHGMPVSAIALTVDKRAGRRGADVLAGLISAAMEAGVNAFHIECCDPEVLETVGRSLAAVERQLLFVSLRLGLGLRLGHTVPTRDFSPNALTGAIDQALAHTGLGYLDLVLLHRPREDELPTTALAALKQERTTGRVGLIGVAGAHDAVDTYMDVGAFDVLASPHNPRVGAKELNRIKVAARMDMGVIVYDYFPEIFHQQATPPGVPQKRGPQKRGLQKRGLLDAVAGPPEPHPLAGAGTFSFLHETTNWTAEELCLAYALMDPTVSTVLIRAYDLKRLEALASVPDRDLPPGTAAKVEMARVSMEQAAGTSSTTDVIEPIDCIIPYHEAFNIIDAFDALRSSIADDSGSFSGVVAPKVENIFNDFLRYLSGKTVVERSGRALHALSPANPALHSPAPHSSLRAKTVTPPDPLSAESAESGETSHFPPVDVTPYQPSPASQPSAAQLQMAIWRSKDYDYPVRPTGENYPGPDGRTYLKVDFNGSLTFVPADEMIYSEDMTPPQPAPPGERPETGGGEGPAETGLGEQVMRVANGR